MKTWTTPVMQELDVRLTASSGIPSQQEQNGYLSGPWNDPTYDSSVYEDNGDCVIPKKNDTVS